jgi:putative inorganic carbon (hco3(-)) transporter
VIAVDDSKDADRATRPRAMGTIGDPNFYAQIMVALLPICALRMWAERKRYLRWAAAIAMVPILGAVVLTFSRGAALALIAFCAALVAMRYLKARYLVIPVAAAILVVASTPEYALRVSTLLKVTSPGMRAADSSLQERSTIYLAAAQIFLDHPLLGVGVGQVKEYLPAYSNSVGHSRVHRKMGAHDMYLELLADTGILGFGVFMLMVGVSIRRLLRLRKYWINRNPEFAHSATGLLLAIAVFLVTGLFLHLAYARYFWLLLVLAGSASYAYRPQLQEKDLRARSERYPAVPHARGVTRPAYLT